VSNSSIFNIRAKVLKVYRIYSYVNEREFQTAGVLTLKALTKGSASYTNRVKSTDFVYLLLLIIIISIKLMVVNMYKHMAQVVIKLLQGSAVT